MKVEGYWLAYEDFYRWNSIFRGARTKATLLRSLRHIAYAGAWKKFEPLWDLIIRAKQTNRILPFLETVLDHFRLDDKSTNHNRTAPSLGRQSVPMFAAADLYDR